MALYMRTALLGQCAVSASIVYSDWQKFMLLDDNEHRCKKPFSTIHD